MQTAGVEVVASTFERNTPVVPKLSVTTLTEQMVALVAVTVKDAGPARLLPMVAQVPTVE